MKALRAGNRLLESKKTGSLKFKFGGVELVDCDILFFADRIQSSTGVVIEGVCGGVLLVLAVGLVVVLLLLKRSRTKRKASARLTTSTVHWTKRPPQDAEQIKMDNNDCYATTLAFSSIQGESRQQEKMDITQNVAYGTTSQAGSLTNEYVYEMPDKQNSNLQASTAEDYDYIVTPNA